MGRHIWNIVPLSKGQLLDVRPEDVLCGGLYRRCETYRGGGGYDQFYLRSEQYLGEKHHIQFIVQLRGCNLDCPYCYVTREGVWGTPKLRSTADLVRDFAQAKINQDCTVLHLMGGAPALQLKFWPELLDELEATVPDYVFHSDLMTSEGEYDRVVLANVARPRAIYAVDLKGLSHEEHLHNTRKAWQPLRMWRNLERLEVAGLQLYLTFTECSENSIAEFWELYTLRFGKELSVRRRRESFSISLIEYDAAPLIDSVPWGWRGF